MRHARSAWIELACLASSWMGCAGGPARPAPQVDCSLEAGYELEVLQAMEGDPDAMLAWFDFGDSTPGAVGSHGLEPIPGGRCGSSSAMVFHSSGHTDWGSGFGEYQTAMAPVDASGYEGIAFWARATGFGTSDGFLITLNDRNTSADGGVCTERMADDVASGTYTYNEAGMIVPIGGTLPGPDDCGNAFQRTVTAHREWFLHLLPFDSFLQTANPNRSPTGIDRSGLYGFAINLPKDSNIELWIDDLALYRRHRPGADAGNAD